MNSVYSHEFTSSASSEKTELVYATPYNLWTLDPFDTIPFPTKQLFHTIFSGLYERDSSDPFEFQPIIADGSPTILVNGTDFADPSVKIKVRVHIKPDLAFSDGNPLTADDVVFTYHLHLTPKVNTVNYRTWTYYFQSNESIRKIDDLTVEFAFKEIGSNFFLLLSTLILPQEVYEPAINAKNYDFNDYETFLVGAGPFMIDDVSEDRDYVRVVRNPKWFGSPPLLSSIVFKEYVNSDDALNAFNTGEVDILSSDLILNSNDLENMTQSKIVRVVSPQWYEISMNHIHPVFGDTAQQDQFLNTTWGFPSGNFTVTSYWEQQGVTQESDRREKARFVREAIDTIVPRRFIINNSFSSFGVPAATIWPNTSLGFDPSIQAREYSVAQARTLMEQAGFDYSKLSYDAEHDTFTSFFFNITILAPNTCPARTHIPSYMKEEFPKIGIGIKEEQYLSWPLLAPRTFFFDKGGMVNGPIPTFNEGGYDIMFLGYGGTLEFDPSMLYETYSWDVPDNGFNWYNWYDPQYDALIQQYVNERDYQTKINYAHELQQYYYENIIVSTVYHSEEAWVFNSLLIGYNALLLSIGEEQWENIGFEKVTTTTTTTSSQSQGIIFAWENMGLVFLPIFVLGVIERVTRKKESTW